MEDRILSLENQLDQKQQIIEKLMETPKVDVIPARIVKEKAASPKSTSTANDSVQLIDINSKEDVKTTAAKEKNSPKTNKNNESSRNKDLNRDQQIVKNGKQKQVENEVQSEQAAREATRSNVERSRSNAAQKEANDNTRKKIFLVGDSIVNGIQEKGLSTKHNIRIRRCPGDTTKDLVDHVKPISRKQPDLVLFHFGTNDITNAVDTEEHMQKAIDHYAKNPLTRILQFRCVQDGLINLV